MRKQAKLTAQGEVVSALRIAVATDDHYGGFDVVRIETYNAERKRLYRIALRAVRAALER